MKKYKKSFLSKKSLFRKMFLSLIAFSLYQPHVQLEALGDLLNSTLPIDGCNEENTHYLPGSMEGETFDSEMTARESGCLFIQTAFILGEKLKITVAFPEGDSGWGKPVESTSFIGVSSKSELITAEGKTYLAPKRLTLIKLENTADKNTSVKVVTALPSVETTTELSQRGYYSTLSSFKWPIKYSMNDKNAGKIVKMMVIPFKTGVVASFSGNDDGKVVQEEFDDDGRKEKSESEVKEGSFNGTQLTTDLSCQPRGNSSTGDVSASIKWTMIEQSSEVKKFIGAIKNQNAILNFANLVGPFDVPIWGYITAVCLVVVIIILLIVLCCCCCCCKKKKKSNKSSSTSSSSSFSSS